MMGAMVRPLEGHKILIHTKKCSMRLSLDITKKREAPGSMVPQQTLEGRVYISKAFEGLLYRANLPVWGALTFMKLYICIIWGTEIAEGLLLLYNLTMVWK